MSKVYCTYFDHRYLTKGLVMIRSLRRHVPGAQIWVLCLDARAHGMMEELAEPGVRAIALCDFEAGDAALAKAKADGRSVVEYIFTLTPTLVRYVMRIVPEAEIVTYLDGDLWFLADPEPVYREMGSASVLIIPHGFEPRMKHLERHGIYNVGWVSFRRDSQGTACFEWWRERTNEWCLDQVDAGRFATTVIRPSIKANGIFSENGDAQLWLSDDANRYPVQLKSRFSKFSLTLELQSVKPGDRVAQEAMIAEVLAAR